MSKPIELLIFAAYPVDLSHFQTSSFLLEVFQDFMEAPGDSLAVYMVWDSDIMHALFSWD